MFGGREGSWQGMLQLDAVTGCDQLVIVGGGIGYMICSTKCESLDCKTVAHGSKGIKRNIVVIIMGH